MVSDTLGTEQALFGVLILVVMEYGLRQAFPCCCGALCVLILVVMEYGLRPARFGDVTRFCFVLILVVMEYGLRPVNCHNGCLVNIVLILVVMEYGLRPILMAPCVLIAIGLS